MVDGGKWDAGVVGDWGAGCAVDGFWPGREFGDVDLVPDGPAVAATGDGETVWRKRHGSGADRLTAGLSGQEVS